MMQQIIDTAALASQPNLSHFYSRFDAQSMAQMNWAKQTMIDKVHQQRVSKAVIFDLDSTHADTYGEQESTAYNAHYDTVGNHPLGVFEGITDDFLKGKLRPGNVYPSNGVVDFICLLITHYNDTLPETIPYLCSDSGFALPAPYALL